MLNALQYIPASNAIQVERWLQSAGDSLKASGSYAYNNASFIAGSLISAYMSPLVFGTATVVGILYFTYTSENSQLMVFTNDQEARTVHYNHTIKRKALYSFTPEMLNYSHVALTLLQICAKFAKRGLIALIAKETLKTGVEIIHCAQHPLTKALAVAKVYSGCASAFSGFMFGSELVKLFFLCGCNFNLLGSQPIGSSKITCKVVITKPFVRTKQ